MDKASAQFFCTIGCEKKNDRARMTVRQHCKRPRRLPVRTCPGSNAPNKRPCKDDPNGTRRPLKQRQSQYSHSQGKFFIHTWVTPLTSIPPARPARAPLNKKAIVTWLLYRNPSEACSWSGLRRSHGGGNQLWYGRENPDDDRGGESESDAKMKTCWREEPGSVSAMGRGSV